MNIQAKSDKVLTPEYLDWYSKLIDLPTTISDKLRSKLYKIYKKKTDLDPWMDSKPSESKQIEEDAKEKDVIIETVHKRFPFLTYTNLNAWHQDVFKYTDSEAKCPICKEVHTRLGIWGDWSCLDKNDHYYLNCPFRIDQKKVIIAIQSLSEIQPEAGLRQYAIEHKMDPEKFSVITEAEKKRWIMGCFRGDLERDIRCYQDGIKRKEDPRKYHKFLTDRDRLIGEELLHRSILKSRLSTVWLDDLIKEWEESHTQF
ncbi:7808_t:CDS:2, partial [Ambispora gerdemannii]